MEIHDKHSAPFTEDNFDHIKLYSDNFPLQRWEYPRTLKKSQTIKLHKQQDASSINQSFYTVNMKLGKYQISALGRRDKYDARSSSLIYVVIVLHLNKFDFIVVFPFTLSI